MISTQGFPTQSLSGSFFLILCSSRGLYPWLPKSWSLVRCLVCACVHTPGLDGADALLHEAWHRAPLALTQLSQRASKHLVWGRGWSAPPSPAPPEPGSRRTAGTFDVALVPQRLQSGSSLEEFTELVPDPAQVAFQASGAERG